MPDITLTNLTNLTENGAASSGSTLNTGDLRRQYAFGPAVTELNIMQDPFLRLLSMYRRKPTNDPQFKFAEARSSLHRRYGYVVAHGTDSSVSTTADATVSAANIAVGKTYYWKIGTDYKWSGSIGNVYGNSSTKVDVGDSGTRPRFFMPNQIIKIPFGPAYNNPQDYVLAKIKSVTTSGEYVILETVITRTLLDSTNNELQWASATAPMTSTYNYAAANRLDGLESKKVYVVGTAFGRGSGLPDTWFDQPYSTGYGLTQIWKTALSMDNTTMATELKYSANEWARLWGQKLIEHKWDIETDLLFGSQYIDDEGNQYTQGIVDYVLNYGNIFSLDHSTKTLDDFLDDLSQFMDPRSHVGVFPTIFLCDTYTYNWLNKLSGFFANNIAISSQFRGDFSFQERKTMGGVEVNVISTIYGDLNLVRNVHLDGTGVHIAAVNMNNVAYRPLVGNGLNRDTSIYPGVQRLETTGIDRRVDLILTEAGMEITGPELHAVWK